jgi:hypothetical protein
MLGLEAAYISLVEARARLFVYVCMHAFMICVRMYVCMHVYMYVFNVGSSLFDHCLCVFV